MKFEPPAVCIHIIPTGAAMISLQAPIHGQEQNLWNYSLHIRIRGNFDSSVIGLEDAHREVFNHTANTAACPRSDIIWYSARGDRENECIVAELQFWLLYLCLLHEYHIIRGVCKNVRWMVPENKQNRTY
jgi:hypothetical protein